jgi:hypothetical protein
MGNSESAAESEFSSGRNYVQADTDLQSVHSLASSDQEEQAVRRQTLGVRLSSPLSEDEDERVANPPPQQHERAYERAIQRIAGRGEDMEEEERMRASAPVSFGMLHRCSMFLCVRVCVCVGVCLCVEVFFF